MRNPPPTGEDDDVPEGYERIFVRYVTRNGRRIYPKKGRVFCLLVKQKQ